MRPRRLERFFSTYLGGLSEDFGEGIAIDSARQVVVSGGQTAKKLMLPLGFVTDERICGGAEYAVAVHMWLEYLKHPELLELTPEEEEAQKIAKAEA